MDNRKTDVIIQIGSRENQLYGLAASGKLYLLKVKPLMTQDKTRALLDENQNFILSHDWELIIDSPDIK